MPISRTRGEGSTLPRRGGRSPGRLGSTSAITGACVPTLSPSLGPGAAGPMASIALEGSSGGGGKATRPPGGPAGESLQRITGGVGGVDIASAARALDRIRRTRLDPSCDRTSAPPSNGGGVAWALSAPILLGEDRPPAAQPAARQVAASRPRAIPTVRAGGREGGIGCWAILGSAARDGFRPSAALLERERVRFPLQWDRRIVRLSQVETADNPNPLRERVGSRDRPGNRESKSLCCGRLARPPYRVRGRDARNKRSRTRWLRPGPLIAGPGRP